MIRTLAILLILWGQLVAGCLQSGVVLCVHEDGSTAIELSTALCCDGDLTYSQAADDDCCRDADECDGDESNGAKRSDDDCCQDFLLQHPQLTIAPSDVPPDRAHHDSATVSITALPASLVAEPRTVLIPPYRGSAPPGPDVVRICLRSVQLRC